MDRRPVVPSRRGNGQLCWPCPFLQRWSGRRWARAEGRPSWSGPSSSHRRRNRNRLRTQCLCSGQCLPGSGSSILQTGKFPSVRRLPRLIADRGRPWGGLNGVRGTKHDIHPAAVGFPARHAGGIVLIRVGDSPIVLLFELILGGVWGGIASQPEVLDELVPLSVI